LFALETLAPAIPVMRGSVNLVVEGAHMLRHATGFKLANQGVDTRSLQQYLGHKNIQLRSGIQSCRLSVFETFGKIKAARRPSKQRVADQSCASLNCCDRASSKACSIKNPVLPSSMSSGARAPVQDVG
jgi:hypothetical protein